MAHVVRHPTAPWASRSGALTVHQVPAAHDNLVWLLVCNATREAAAIDGPDAEATLGYCESQGLSLTTIFNTHTHADHIGINRDLSSRGLLGRLDVYGPRLAQSHVPGITHAVSEGDTVQWGALEGQVLLTEGHINGHISYVFEDILFCGDTLFAGGCGYLFDGPPLKMFESLNRLASLPPQTKVCCAHEYTQDNLRFAWSVEPGNDALAERMREAWAVRAEGRCTLPSSIELERATNPFVRSDSEEIRTSVQRAFPEQHISTRQDVFAFARALKDRKDYRSVPDSSLPL